MRLSIEGIDFSTCSVEFEKWAKEMAQREFKNLNEMTPAERAEFEELKEKFDYLSEYGYSSNPIPQQDRERRNMEDFAAMLTNALGGDKVATLEKENKALQEDRAYWIARAKVLESMLLKVSPESVAIERKIHLEFLTKMVREELLIRTRKEPEKMKVIEQCDESKSWNNPRVVLNVLMNSYKRLFLDVLGKPLDPDDREPYWQQYVKTLVSLSPHHEKFVGQSLAVCREVLDEWNERLEIVKNIRERIAHYLDSVYYDASMDGQRWIEAAKKSPDYQKALSLSPGAMFDDDMVAFLKETLPDRLGFDARTLSDEYDRANAVRYQAAIEAYEEKLKDVATGKIRKAFTWTEGYGKTVLTTSSPESFEFDGSAPGMN